MMAMMIMMNYHNVLLVLSMGLKPSDEACFPRSGAPQSEEGLLPSRLFFRAEQMSLMSSSPGENHTGPFNGQLE